MLNRFRFIRVSRGNIRWFSSSLSSSLVSPDWIQDNASDNIVVLNCSPASIHAQAHIPESVLLPSADKGLKEDCMKKMLEMGNFVRLMQTLHVNNDSTLVFYDHQLSLWATRAWWVARSYGHAPEKLKILDGGLVRWLHEDKPIQTATNINPKIPEKSSNYVTPTLQGIHGSHDLSKILQALDPLTRNQSPDLQFIDCRSESEFAGAQGGNARGGRLPTAIHFEWLEAMDLETHQFKSREEIQALLQAAGVDLAKPVTTYCQLAIRAAHTAFVLQELLHLPQVAVYEGSMNEYLNSSEAASLSRFE